MLFPLYRQLFTQGEETDPSRTVYTCHLASGRNLPRKVDPA